MAGSIARPKRHIAAGATMADKEGARKARKRDTDRQSQRHHRERQRAYIQSLEEMVSSYKQSCSQSSNPDVATLMADNGRLRERCHRLESLLSRIKRLSSGIDPSDGSKDSGSSPNNEGDRAENDRSSDTSRQIPQMPTSHGDLQVPSTSTTAALSNEAQGQSCQAENCSATSNTQPRLNETSLFEDPPSMSVPTLPKSLVDTGVNTCTFADYREAAGYGTMTNLHNSNFLDNAFDLIDSSGKDKSTVDATDAPSSDFHAAQINSLNNTGDDNVSSELQQCLDSILDDTAMSLALVPMSLTTRTPLLAQQAKQQYGSSSPPPGPLSLAEVNSAHRAFPMTVEACTWDRILLGIIDEAKTQHAAGLYPTEKPTLHSVLSNRSSDVLAYRLYHFICSYGPMPLHNFLAIFWVQYLALRWYVLGTAAAYVQIPDFMKPTDLERRIPHSMSIGMLVWPDIRRTLIRDSSVMDTQATGTALLHHLNSNWSPTYRTEGDFIGNTDVLSVIERQACSLDAWKISRKFGELNPQFAHCQLLHFD